MAAILVFTAAIAFAISPWLVPGFNGFEPDQFPVPQTDPPAQPAGYAFSIWGLIYVWLIAGTGFGLFKRHDDRGWQPHRWPLFASLTLGAAWLPVAQTAPVWATVMIWAMLGTGIWALLVAGQADRAWQRGPIAVYAGWLTAASCVAMALVLAGYGLMSGQAAALVMIGVALIIAAMVQTARPATPEYGAAVIWALVAVIVANAQPLNLPVIALCGAGIALLGALIFRNLRQPRRRFDPSARGG